MKNELCFKGPHIAQGYSGASVMGKVNKSRVPGETGAAA